MNLLSAADWKTLYEKADALSLEQAQEYLKDAPGAQERLYVLALTHLNVHNDNEAEGLFQKILSLNQDFLPAKWGLAEVHRRNHKLSESAQMLAEIISTDPGFAPAYISLGYIHYIKRDFEQSVELASWVIKSGREHVDLSNYVRAYLLIAGSKGMIAHYGGPFSKLINGTAVYPMLKKAEALQPNAPGVLFGIGSFYLLAPRFVGGNLKEAQKYLLRAIDVDPRFSDAYVRLAQLYKIKGDIAKYEEYLRKALEIDPKNEVALDIQSKKCAFICPSGKE
jgi:tetratricopeptide (TPR) repeat protein